MTGTKIDFYLMASSYPQSQAIAQTDRYSILALEFTRTMTYADVKLFGALDFVEWAAGPLDKNLMIDKYPKAFQFSETLDPQEKAYTPKCILRREK